MQSSHNLYAPWSASYPLRKNIRTEAGNKDSNKLNKITGNFYAITKKTLSIQREMLEDGKNHRRVPKKGC